MNFLTATVEITVDDRPVKVKLSEIKKAFSQTVDGSENLSRRMSSSFITAVAKMVAAYISFTAMVRATKWGISQAMQAEDAIFALTAALKSTGEYSRDTMTKLGEFASAMQEVTVYSNNQVLAMMQTAKTLGVNANQLKLATQWTIALSDALGMGTESASRYVALALKGEYTMLRRYIPALREAKTTTESFQILQEFMNRAFEVSTTRAQTTSGALKQMRNALGEVGEAIGYAILPALKSVAVGIRDWAIRNRDTIAYWANVVMAYVTYVKDVFVDWLKFMQKDFSGGIKIAFAVTWELAKGFVDGFVVIIAEGASLAANAFIEKFGVKVAQSLATLAQKTKYFMPLPALAEIVAAKKLMEVAVTPPAARPPVGPQLKVIAKETADNINTIMKNANINISDDSKRLQDKLLELERYKVEGFALMEQEMAAKSTDLTSETSTKIKKINDSLIQEVKNSQKILVEEELKERWESLAKSIEGSISSAFERLIFEGETLKDFMKNLAAAIIQDFIRIQFIRPVAEQLGGMMVGVMKRVTPSVLVPTAHEGWDVGEYTAKRRLVPAYAFASAKRYDWLRPGEEAVIAERGERITRGGSLPVTVNFNLSAVDAQGSLNFIAKNRRQIANAVSAAARSNSPFRRSR